MNDIDEVIKKYESLFKIPVKPGDIEKAIEELTRPNDCYRPGQDLIPEGDPWP